MATFRDNQSKAARIEEEKCTVECGSKRKERKNEENRFFYSRLIQTPTTQPYHNYFFLFSSAHHREKLRKRVSSSAAGSKQFSGRDFVCLRDVTLLKSPSALPFVRLCICEQFFLLLHFSSGFLRLNKKHTVIHQWSSALTHSRAALSAGLDSILRLIFTGSMVTCLHDFSRGAYRPCLGNTLRPNHDRDNERRASRCRMPGCAM